jgi:uncharacterized membrane protein (DUF4010 family)
MNVVLCPGTLFARYPFGMAAEHFPTTEIALKLSAALGIGLLVGFEREWSNKDVGVRTFALVSLLGMAALLISPYVAIAALLPISILVAVVNVRSMLVDRSLEITTSVALLVIYVLGALVGSGHLFTPVASAILMTLLLAWKTEFQRFAGGLKPEEIRSAVLLGLIGFVIYPILPDRFLDRWQLVNPREAWITVIVVAGIGFVNYVLLRLYSTRGLYWSAVLGGLVNSTAAIIELSRSLIASGLSRMAVLVSLLTVEAMFLRNLTLLAIFAHPALVTAVGPLVAMSVVAALILWRSRNDRGDSETLITLSSPLSIRRVLQFGGFFLVIEVVGNIASRIFGNWGFLTVSAIGGLFSSASAAVAAANLATRGAVSPGSAGVAVVLASMASAVVNIPLVARQTKDSRIGSRLAVLTGLQLIAGIATLLAQHYLHIHF